MDIRITGQHGSISDMEWLDIPPLAVLTGGNGVGKTQLLEVIANAFGQYHPEAPQVYTRMPQQGIQPKATAGIAPSFAAGSVLFSRSEWSPLTTDFVTVETIVTAFLELWNERQSHQQGSSWWMAFQDDTGLTAEEIVAIRFEEFLDKLTPVSFWRYKHANGQGLSFLFQAYRWFEATALERGATPKSVLEKYGQAPWLGLNEILAASGMPYQVNEPPRASTSILAHKLNPGAYGVTLRHDNGEHVKLEALSSGERVIVATLFWQFGADREAHNYRLLLLDEPDAHLHPSLTRRFLDVLQRVFIDRRGVQVIMTTHSPTTVALAPPGSVFQMWRTGSERIRPASNIGSAIATLTEGFVAVEEATRFVLVEGPDDVPFYEVVRDLLGQSTPGATAPLSKFPPLAFLHGKGAPTVSGLVRQLRAHGLVRFSGLIDGDRPRDLTEGVRAISRRAIENFLFDPIVVWLAVRIDGAGNGLERVGVRVADAMLGRMETLPGHQLQEIVDQMLAIVRGNLADATALDDAQQQVKFVGGLTLTYPRWFLQAPKDSLHQAFRAAFKHHNVTSSRLLRAYSLLHLVAQELQELMLSIQQDSADGNTAGT
jgi:ABC-type transport system involved in cytochrome c biogenesis ATPase subunit